MTDRLAASIGNRRANTLDALTDHALAGRDVAPLVQAVARADDALTLLRTGDEDGARGAVVHLARALAAAGCESYVSGSVASSCRGLAAAWRSVLLANPR